MKSLSQKPKLRFNFLKFFNIIVSFFNSSNCISCSFTHSPMLAEKSQSNCLEMAALATTCTTVAARAIKKVSTGEQKLKWKLQPRLDVFTQVLLPLSNVKKCHFTLNPSSEPSSKPCSSTSNGVTEAAPRKMFKQRYLANEKSSQVKMGG